MTDSRKVIWLGLSSAIIAMVIAALLYAGCVTSPMLIESLRGSEGTAVCGALRPGMTFSQMNEALHRHVSYSREYADFAANKYFYAGRAGTCVVSLDEAAGRVIEVRFISPDDDHLRRDPPTPSPQ
jgi:hypothetical protein